MISCESHAIIGYGAMLMESFVGVMALIAAAILIPGDYLAINSRLGPEALAALGYPVGRIESLSALVGIDVAGRPGGAVSLAVGMASIFSSLPGMKNLMAYWYQFALLFEALFILTTIDAGTRIARYLLQEMGGNLYPPLCRINWWPGVLLSSFLVVFAWGYLISTGSIATIWPMFGAANQLLGTLALSVGTTVLIKMGKAKFIWVTLFPMLFVGTVTLSGSLQLFLRFLVEAQTDSPQAFALYLDAGLIALVALLAIVILVDSAVKWYGYLVLRTPVISTEYHPDF
jgi:carbon starvation protein